MLQAAMTDGRSACPAASTMKGFDFDGEASAPVSPSAENRTGTLRWRRITTSSATEPFSKPSSAPGGRAAVQAARTGFFHPMGCNWSCSGR